MFVLRVLPVTAAAELFVPAPPSVAYPLLQPALQSRYAAQHASPGAKLATAGQNSGWVGWLLPSVALAAAAALATSSAPAEPGDPPRRGLAGLRTAVVGGGPAGTPLN